MAASPRGELSAIAPVGRNGRYASALWTSPRRSLLSVRGPAPRACAMRNAVFLGLLTLSACAAPGGSYPSLQPRAAEAIDPRVPVIRPVNDRPVTAGLAARLAALVDQARSGATA